MKNDRQIEREATRRALSILEHSSDDGANLAHLAADRASHDPREAKALILCLAEAYRCAVRAAWPDTHEDFTRNLSDEIRTATRRNLP